MSILSVNPSHTFPEEKQSKSFANYTLKWRQRQLFVQRTNQDQTPYLPCLEDQERLSACLERSQVELVRLSSDLSETEIIYWANACRQAGKKVFLQIPSTPLLPKKRAQFTWLCKRLLDQSIAIVALLLLSPLMLGLALLIYNQSPGSILFWQWRVGERGRLFQILKFRTMIEGAEELHHQIMANQPGLHKHKNDPRVTPIGRWMRRYSLDELPQLINVLRGEMSLVGPRPWALYDAIRISPEMRQRLNALPGITGAWQVAARSNLLDINAVTRCDLEYLKSWTFWQDLKILLLTIPKVFEGFGAY